MKNEIYKFELSDENGECYHEIVIEVDKINGTILSISLNYKLSYKYKYFCPIEGTEMKGSIENKERMWNILRNCDYPNIIIENSQNISELKNVLNKEEYTILKDIVNSKIYDKINEYKKKLIRR